MKRNTKSGFTLLEVIIVIIIVGVLASLALPRFFSTVEFSRSTEALMAFTSLRGSMDRCYLSNGSNYTGCLITNLDLSNPGLSPGAHFGYSITGQSASAYTLFATRTTFAGGNASDWIRLIANTVGVSRAGVGAFVGIK